MAYLTAAVRARPNLAIRADAEVDSVVIEGTRAVGVTLVDGEGLSGGRDHPGCGHVRQPRHPHAIRHRAVPASSDGGITTIADLPVSHRLQDQPFFYNVYALTRDANAMTPAAGAIIGRARRPRSLAISTCTLGHASHRPAGEPDRRRDRPRLRHDVAEVDRPAAPVEP